MRHVTILRLALLLVLAALLAAGCATKPAPTEEEAAPQEAPVTQEMPADQVTGIDEQAVQEDQVTDEAAAAAEEAARLEAAAQALERIHFGFDQYVLTEEARQTLKENAEYLENNPGIDVKIEGHTDAIGSDEYNLALGERRAMAAKNYLVSLGISQNRLSTISYGEEKPLDAAETDEARALNRRAEFKPVR